jgi:hypothetical protein
MKAFGKALPAILVGGEAQPPWPPQGGAAPSKGGPAIAPGSAAGGAHQSQPAAPPAPVPGSHLPPVYSLTPEQQQVVAAYSGPAQPGGAQHRPTVPASQTKPPVFPAPGTTTTTTTTTTTVPASGPELCMGCKAR